MQLLLAGPYRQLSNLFASSSSVSSLVRTSCVPVSVHRILRTGFLQYFLLNTQALYMNNKSMVSALYSDGSLMYGSTLQLGKSSHMGWFINLSCFEQIHCNIFLLPWRCSLLHFQCDSTFRFEIRFFSNYIICKILRFTYILYLGLEYVLYGL